MRYIYLLLITVVLASCGNQKIRLVRTKNVQKQEIVTLNKPVRSTEKTVASEPTKRIENEENPSTLTQEEATKHSEDQLITTHSSEETVVDFPEIANDTVRSVSAEQAEIDRVAEKAETSGVLSLVFGALTPIIIVVSAVTALLLWDEIAIIIGLFAAIVFALAAITFAILSLTSEYNTKKGRRSSIIGLIWSIPFLIVSAIILLTVF